MQAFVRFSACQGRLNDLQSARLVVPRSGIHARAIAARESAA